MNNNILVFLSSRTKKMLIFSEYWRWLPSVCMASAEKIWNACWCGPLSSPNHDQLSSMYLFQHCCLFVAAEVIYRVCHLLWLFIIHLIFFHNNNCCQESWHARWVYLCLMFQSRQDGGWHFLQLPAHLCKEPPLSPSVSLLSSFPLSILSISLHLYPSSTSIVLFMDHLYLSKVHKSIP